MNASDLAKSLAAKFLENGNYDLVGASIENSFERLGVRPAAVNDLNEYFADAEGFSGLSVEAVGYTPGAKQEKVIIYVARGSKKMLRSLPKQIDDCPVVVKVLGRTRPGPSPSMARHGVGELFERNDRIACGSSCAPINESFAGTMGAIASLGDSLFVLSNNHVFACCNHTPIGMHICCPSAMDAKAGRRPPTSFATYHQMVELRSGDPMCVTPATLDAAAAIVTVPEAITSWQGDENGFDTPSLSVAPASEMRVKKVGRTTGLTLGVIEAEVNTPWVMPYKSKKFTGHVWFTDTWTARSEDGDPFALPGDSGSLVVTEDGQAAVGLLFATNNSGEYGIFAPINSVLAALGGLQLVSGHGLS